MQYLLLIYGNEQEWTSMGREEMEKVYEGHRDYAARMEQAGVLRGGAELAPGTTATSVRFSEGRTRTTDGPFAETKEQLGGYYLIEVENLDQAIGWAEQMPGMTEGTVEIRPLGAHT